MRGKACGCLSLNEGFRERFHARLTLGANTTSQDAIKAAEQQLKAAAQQPGYCIKVLKVGGIQRAVTPSSPPAYGRINTGPFFALLPCLPAHGHAHR